ncbi:alpha/beta fold hydrolase [Leptospira noguchii]|uniref:Alpha/beta hydrolase family protein n=1 Tax=Leptospira noguchii TaxID=28182 RepID=M6VVY3_9LEPT|nr:alpha/beta fold hydrolase [Leptospira noguchii]EMO53718.1 alpha/beta hydrolase family protein [Leptospira noguchii]
MQKFNFVFRSYRDSHYVFQILFLISFLGCFCSIPEDLKKKPKESLILLKKSGINFKEFNFNVEGKQIYGVASGCNLKNQNILIFIHGSPGGWQNYSWYLENKTLNKKFCIFAMDRPGFGNSNPNEAIPDVEKQAFILGKTIQNFLDQIPLDKNIRIVLVGHSYGGPIAARISIIFSYKIATLVLLAAPLSSKEEEIRWYNKIADWVWVKNLLPISFKNSNDEMFPLKSQLEFLEKFWKLIPCKIILIHGKEDSLVPFHNLEFFKSIFSPSILTTIELEKEDHFIPWTQKILLEKIFLKSIE